MFASSVLITAGNPDSMYLEARQEKWLKRREKTNNLRHKWRSRWLGKGKSETKGPDRNIRRG